MKASRLEEVLDECLTAYFDGRRTVEESLSLYPSIRHELEPLLRTAIELAEAFRAPSPRPHLQERGRQEFLRSAALRQRARELTEDVNFSRRLSGAALGVPRIAFIVGAFCLSFAAVAAAVIAFDSSPPHDSGLQAGFVSPSGSPDIGQLRETQERLRDQALGGEDVSSETIRELAAQTRELQAQLEFAALDARRRLELEMAISEQFLLLRLIAGSRAAAEAAPAATQALEVTERVAEDLGVELPGTPVSTVAATPSSAPTEAPTPAATASPASSASLTPTPPPSTTTPTPETPELR